MLTLKLNRNEIIQFIEKSDFETHMNIFNLRTNLKMFHIINAFNKEKLLLEYDN